jgi:hypothetical protein
MIQDTSCIFLSFGAGRTEARDPRGQKAFGMGLRVVALNHCLEFFFLQGILTETQTAKRE